MYFTDFTSEFSLHCKSTVRLDTRMPQKSSRQVLHNLRKSRGKNVLTTKRTEKLLLLSGY